MKTAVFKIWRGDANGGQFSEFTTEISEGMVVLDVRPHRQGRGGHVAVEEDGGAGGTQDRRLALVEVVDERPQRTLVVLAPQRDDLAAALPGGEHGEGDHADQER